MVTKDDLPMIPSSFRKLTSHIAPMREMSRRDIDAEHYQPQDQDSSGDSLGIVAEIGSRRRLLAGEPEDARLTGGTRSLMRRLTGLNMRVERRMAPLHMPKGKSPQAA